MLSQNIFEEHLKSLSCEIRCFYYLNNNVIITKNNSNIMIYKDFSLFVIVSPPFLLKNKKGKASDIFEGCIYKYDNN